MSTHSAKILTTEEINELCISSYQLLQTMGNIYGSDSAYEMFQKFEEVLGPEIKSALFLKMLSNDYQNENYNSVSFSIPAQAIHGYIHGYVNIIKACRTYGINENGQCLGLKEAKDIVDLAKSFGRAGLRFANSSDRMAFINELLTNGGKVER